MRDVERRQQTLRGLFERVVTAVGIGLLPGLVILPAEDRQVEVAMRIDSTDLESALKAQHKKNFDLQAMSDDDAEQIVDGYLRGTLTLGGEKLTKEQFRWVGWQKEARHAWVYFELPLAERREKTLQLKIRTLFEVEPELQHVVVLGDNAGKRTVIVSDGETVVEILIPRD